MSYAAAFADWDASAGNACEIEAAAEREREPEDERRHDDAETPAQQSAAAVAGEEDPGRAEPQHEHRQDPAQRVEESDRALRVSERRGVEELIAQRERPDREFVEDADAPLRQVRAQLDRDRREIDRDLTVAASRSPCRHR